MGFFVAIANAFAFWASDVLVEKLKIPAKEMFSLDTVPDGRPKNIRAFL